MAVPPSTRQEDPLLARYRRVLAFGDVLDESVHLFRQRWVTFALISAVALLPPGLVSVWLSASGVLGRTISLAEIQSGRLAQTAALGRVAALLVADNLISMLFLLLWSAATVVATDVYLRGGEPRLPGVYVSALRRYWAVLVASLGLLLALAVLVALGTALFVVTGFGAVGAPLALLALVAWWLKPSARKTWVKWLIVLAAPFGLPAYVLGRWSMYIPAAVLERHGPLGALRRSSRLVDRHWFRVVSALTVSGLIVAVLQWAPATLIEVPLTLSSATQGQVGLAPPQAAIANAVGVVLNILFASIGSIAYTLVFVDLRNRAEGADILERLAQLEAQPVPAHG